MAGEQVSKIDIEQVIQRFPRLGMSRGMSTQGEVIWSPFRRCAECIAHHQGASMTGRQQYLLSSSQPRHTDSSQAQR